MDKMTFGEFIRLKRTELGLTQKQLAEQLYLTESAVSKWERNASLPDICMLRELSKILQVTESELINASIDKQSRLNSALAKKYLDLIFRIKAGQISTYLIAIVVCLIVNVCVNKKLSWSIIVIFSLFIPASITLAPAYIKEKKLWKVLALFYGSIVLLNTYIGLYIKDGFFVIVLCCFLLLSSITIVPLLNIKNKKLIIIASFFISLILLLLVCSIYSRGDWFLITFISVTLGLSIIFVPFILPYIKFIKNQKGLVYMVLETSILFILLLIADFYTKTNSFFTISIPVTLFVLILPWAIFLLIRYIKMNGYYKAGFIFIIVSIHSYFIEPVINTILNTKAYWIKKVDFKDFQNCAIGNIYFIVCMSLFLFSLTCFIFGYLKRK